MKKANILTVAFEKDECEELENTMEIMKKYIEEFDSEGMNGYWNFHKALKDGLKALEAIYSGKIDNSDFRKN